MHGPRRDYIRVVIMTALPIDTLRRVCHISRFIFGSIPVENSSMRMTVGFPIQTQISQGKKYIVKKDGRTYKSDSE